MCRMRSQGYCAAPTRQREIRFRRVGICRNLRVGALVCICMPAHVDHYAMWRGGCLALLPSAWGCADDDLWILEYDRDAQAHYRYGSTAFRLREAVPWVKSLILRMVSL